MNARRPLFVGFWGALALAACRGGHLDPSSEPAPPLSASALPPAPSSATARAFNADRFSRRPYMPDVVELGRALFFDQTLSASGKLACATCHDPRFAYGPANDRDTPLGGLDLKRSGLRAVPSLRYLQNVPRFSEHYFDEAVDESVDQGPTGGHTWDGRADTLHDQARLPLLSPLEMANASIESVVNRVERAPYAERFRKTFGSDVFEEPERASTAVLLALEVFQQSPNDFYPYTSRYDAYLRKQATLSPAEQRGLAWFDDPKKGNCAHCHVSQVRHGAFPQFTDFGFAALGVPRNPNIPDNADAHFFDLGLGGPLRVDLAKQAQYRGLFRAPPLRNVALRKVFFHNGVFHRLQDVLHFYAERDTRPSKWYRRAAPPTGFDDLPADAQQNVNREPPFGRQPGQAPALSEAEIRDLIAFLGTLTDADLRTE